MLLGCAELEQDRLHPGVWRTIIGHQSAMWSAAIGRSQDPSMTSLKGRERERGVLSIKCPSQIILVISVGPSLYKE